MSPDYILNIQRFTSIFKNSVSPISSFTAVNYECDLGEFRSLEKVVFTTEILEKEDYWEVKTHSLIFILPVCNR